MVSINLPDFIIGVAIGYILGELFLSMASSLLALIVIQLKNKRGAK